MKKLSSTAFLFLIFLLLGVYVLVFENPWQENEKQKSELNLPLYASFQSQDVYFIDYKTKEGELIALEKKGENWLVGEYKANTEAIEQLIDKILETKQQQIVSKKPENWSKFEVGEEEGIDVVLKDKSAREIANFQIGKMGGSYMSQYVRKNSSDEVILVNQALGLYFSRPRDGWRDQTILSLNKDQIDSIKVLDKTGNTSFLTQTASGWTLNDTEIDLEKVTPVIEAIANLKTDSFPKENAFFELNSADYIIEVNLLLNNTEDDSDEINEPSIENRQISLKADESGENFYLQVGGDPLLYKINKVNQEKITLRGLVQEENPLE